MRVDRIERPTGLHSYTMWVPSEVRVGAQVTRDIYMYLCVAEQQSAAIVASNVYNCQTGSSLIKTPFLAARIAVASVGAGTCICSHT